MATMPADTIERTNHMLVINRTFDAPRELVFEMWTNAEHLGRWFGPRGTTMLACESDARPGGALRLYFRMPNGEEIRIRGVFQDVQAPERLSYSESFTDAEGRAVKRPGFPLATIVTASFAEREGRTAVTVEHAGADEFARESWSATLDHLAEHIDHHHREETNQ